MDEYYSYLMGGNDKVLELTKYGFKINQNERGSYEIIFPSTMERKFEKYVLNNLKPGFWNEWLNNERVYFLFRFKNGDFRGYELSEKNEEEILKLCKAFANTDFKSIKDMLMENEFYGTYIKL